MANKTFNTRVKNKRDTAANWEAVATTFQPLDGELIIVDTAAGKTRFKVGRYDTAKGRLLYYNEIPFTDEYLYNDLNESQGKIYDKLKGIDDKSIIEMTLESVFDNTKFVNYRIGLWQFGKTGFYKLNIPKRGTTATQLMLYAQKTKEDGTTPEDPFSQDNLLRISPLNGDKQVESVFVQVDYTDTDTLTVYKVQFLNVITFPGTININTYNKTTQKWDFTSVTESSAKWANNATQVSNALTLTKGDTTTKFDGSTAQTVEIPTKTSELTNDSNFTTQTDLDNLTNTVVSYNAQENITDEQKAQARTNIGAISSSELVQSDWNQNNETAKDYIKNRPGAYFSGETIEITQSLENLTWHTQDTLKIAQIQRTDIPDKLYENIPYEICWGNEKHYIKLTSIDGQLKFGDTDNEGMPVFTNYPFFIQPVPSNGLAIALPNTSTPPSSISIKFNQGLVKLSEGYIDQIPGKISLYNRTSNICSVDTLEIGVIEDNEFYGVENNQIGYLPTSNGVSGGLALFSPIPPFNQARMTWLGADSLSQFLSNSKSFNSDFGDNVQENVRYNQALSEIHRYSYTLDHCRATIGFAGNDYYNFKLYCDTTTSTKAIPTAIGYTVKNNKVYQLKVTANNLSTNGQVDFVFTEFLDLDTIASKSDISTIDTALSSTSENPVQNKVITTEIQAINNKFGGLTGAMHFIGKATVDITDGSTTDPVITDYDFTNKKEKGDVILGKDDHKEFVWNGSAWEELGDEGSYVLKTTTINGKALSGNITLTAADVGAASASTIETMQAAIDSKPSAADAVYTATAASTDGVAYTATVSGIDSLTVGASFIMIPNKASTSKAPTLNVNGLGAKPIRRRLSSLTTSLQQGYSTNWIALNKPFTVVYDGTAWVIEGLTKTDGADVYGAVAQATADAKGNNIADTYATIAMLQSLLPKVTTITLTSNWVGDASPYYQDIALSCVTETSIVDLQPAPEQLNSWQDDGIAFTTLSGNGTVRVYVAGGKPSSAISVQVRVQEVTVI